MSNSDTPVGVTQTQVVATLYKPVVTVHVGYIADKLPGYVSKYFIDSTVAYSKSQALQATSKAIERVADEVEKRDFGNMLGADPYRPGGVVPKAMPALDAAADHLEDHLRAILTGRHDNLSAAFQGMGISSENTANDRAESDVQGLLAKFNRADRLGQPCVLQYMQHPPLALCCNKFEVTVEYEGVSAEHAKQ